MWNCCNELSLFLFLWTSLSLFTLFSGRYLYFLVFICIPFLPLSVLLYLNPKLLRSLSVFTNASFRLPLCIIDTELFPSLYLCYCSFLSFRFCSLRYFLFGCCFNWSFSIKHYILRLCLSAYIYNVPALRVLLLSSLFPIDSLFTISSIVMRSSPPVFRFFRLFFTALFFIWIPRLFVFFM